MNPRVRSVCPLRDVVYSEKLPFCYIDCIPSTTTVNTQIRLDTWTFLRSSLEAEASLLTAVGGALHSGRTQQTKKSVLVSRGGHNRQIKDGE